MLTFGSLFTGFDGVGVGALACGLDLAWGMELDPDLAAVANRNLGGHVRVGDILDADPVDFPPVDVLHASPPCPSFSVAKANGKETPHDIALAEATARFVTILRAPVVTLENVWGYRNSKSWRIIADALNGAGYWFDVAHVNFADMSVPQTRKRMVARALLGRMVPYLPQPEPWVGWYEAIEDLIPTLPESQFAPWQLARLPEELTTALVTNQHNQPNGQGEPVSVAPLEPSPPVTATIGGRFRAFIVSNAKTEYSDGIRDGDEPALAVTGQSSGRTRAFLLGGQFGQPANGNGEARPAQLATDGPTFTVTAVNKGDWRAFLVDGQNCRIEEKGGLSRVLSAEPALSVVASHKGLPRAWLSAGRVVSMTPRCLARFQTFPDWYELPSKNALACKGIGNAVPPLGYQKILKSILD
jgi:DNA (cytosine-5)-methyltransferase 1